MDAPSGSIDAEMAKSTLVPLRKQSEMEACVKYTSFGEIIRSDPPIALAAEVTSLGQELLCFKSLPEPLLSATSFFAVFVAEL